MIAKGYFFVILLIILFVNYYLIFITPYQLVGNIPSIIRDVILVLGGYSAIFKKKLFDQKIWYYAYWFLVLLIIYNLLSPIFISFSQKGAAYAFSNIFVGVGVYLIVLGFFAPLYFYVHKLAYSKFDSPKTKKKRK